MKKRWVYILLMMCWGFGAKAQEPKSVQVATSLQQMYTWDLYPSYQTYLDFMNYYADNYPNFCRLDTIGYSVNGRLLLALKISSAANEDLPQPKFFYSSSIHGNELTGAMVLLHLIDSMLTNPDEQMLDLRNSVQIYICPLANPDGTYFYGNESVGAAVRYNANYLDLNRNFPDFRMGAHPDGEQYQPETMAFMEYALKERFNLSSNLHTGAEVFNYPFDNYRSSQKTHADRDWFVAMGEDFVNSLDINTPASYFHDVTSTGIIDGGDWYVVYGGRQDWHTYSAHCREVTLELSSSYLPSNAQIGKYWTYLKNSLTSMLGYARIGFEGIVVDSITNQPLTDVMVSIVDHDRDSSEVFTNEIGYFFRPILNGDYSLIFSKEGFNSKSIQVSLLDNQMLTLDSIRLVSLSYSLEDETDTDIFTLYPNPSKDVIHIKIDRQAKYKILTLSGTLVLEGEFYCGVNTLNVSDLPQGTYLIELENKTGKIFNIVR